MSMLWPRRKAAPDPVRVEIRLDFPEDTDWDKVGAAIRKWLAKAAAR